MSHTSKKKKKIPKFKAFAIEGKNFCFFHIVVLDYFWTIFSHNFTCIEKSVLDLENHVSHGLVPSYHRAFVGISWVQNFFQWVVFLIVTMSGPMKARWHNGTRPAAPAMARDPRNLACSIGNIHSCCI